MKTHKMNNWDTTWLKSPSVDTIWKILSATGARVFFVGGCVRDTIYGKEINDIDIATESLPSDVVKVLEAAGFQVIKTGFDYGSVTVVFESKVFEITSFRSDLESDGRLPTVEFSSNILDDAKRRDFTMNALYMNIDGSIVDPISGWEDLINGYVRFIGNPEERIREDYLRILRYFRFISIYGKNMDSIDHDTMKACSEAISGLKNLSKNRVWGELKKILEADDPYPALKLMQYSGVLKEILPFARIEKLQKFLTMEKKLKLEFMEMNRLTALNTDHVLSWVKKFPITKKQRKWVDQLLVNLTDPLPLRVKGYKYGMDLASAALILSKSDSLSVLDDQELAEVSYGSLREFPLKAVDLLSFFSPSKELGDEFKRLKNIWFNSNLEFGRNELFIELRDNYRSKDHIVKKESS